MEKIKTELIMDPKTMGGYIDHTVLKPDATCEDIVRLCDEAVTYGFKAVCINPVFVPLAVERLSGTGVNVCTVVGFPLGASAAKTKAGEAGFAVSQGALEIDMVIWVGALKEGRFDDVRNDISRVVQSVNEANSTAIVKVIIETCLLNDVEKINVCRLAEEAGAHFVKTSTGFSTGGATLADVALMRKTVSPRIGVKASGGVRTAAQAIDFIKAGATRIGTSGGVSIINELKP